VNELNRKGRRKLETRIKRCRAETQKKEKRLKSEVKGTRAKAMVGEMVRRQELPSMASMRRMLNLVKHLPGSREIAVLAATTMILWPDNFAKLRRRRLIPSSRKNYGRNMKTIRTAIGNEVPQ
jgi:hypothetical protein